MVQVRSDTVPFSFVPLLVHEVGDHRPPRLVCSIAGRLGLPVPDEDERQAYGPSRQLLVKRVAVPALGCFHATILAYSGNGVEVLLVWWRNTIHCPSGE